MRDDVRRSVEAKAEEIGALRARTLTENAAVCGGGGAAPPATPAARARAGQRRLGHGRDGRWWPTCAPWPAAAALDLTDDPAILTAMANDIGVEAIFSRQVIAHGRPATRCVTLSTSGSAGNVLAALAEARRRGLATVAFVGYDGGRIAAEGLADHVVVVRSEHIPRIQEAQASA